MDTLLNHEGHEEHEDNYFGFTFVPFVAIAFPAVVYQVPYLCQSV